MLAEIGAAQDTWGQFNEFNKEIAEMNKEEWLTYRKKSFYAFNEFTIKYQEKFKGQPKNIVTRFLIKIIEEY